MPSLAAAPILPMPRPAPTAAMPAPIPAPSLPSSIPSATGRFMTFVLAFLPWETGGRRMRGAGPRDGSMLGMDGGVDEDDRELREDVGLHERDEALDDHDEHGECDAEGRGAEAADRSPAPGEEVDQA